MRQRRSVIGQPGTARTPGGVFQRIPSVLRKSERVRNALERLVVRRFAIPALERAHSLHADQRSFCERLLRKTSVYSKLFEKGGQLGGVRRVSQASSPALVRFRLAGS